MRFINQMRLLLLYVSKIGRNNFFVKELEYLFVSDSDDCIPCTYFPGVK